MYSDSHRFLKVQVQVTFRHSLIQRLVPHPWFLLLLFSCSTMSNSLWPHGLQHIRLPCPSLSPWVCSNSCPLSWWCHPIISSSVAPFSSCPQSFPGSGSFTMTQLFATGGQSIVALASALIIPMNIQGWFLLGLTSLICLLSKGLSKSLLQHHNSKASTIFLSLHFCFALGQGLDPDVVDPDCSRLLSSWE